MKEVIKIIKKFSYVLSAKTAINNYFKYNYQSDIKKLFGDISNLQLKRIYNNICLIEQFIDEIINSLREEKRIVKKLLFSKNSFLKSSLESYVSISTMRRYYNEFLDKLFKSLTKDNIKTFKLLDSYF